MKRGKYIKNDVQRWILMLFIGTSLLSSCKNNIPDDLDAFGDDITFNGNSLSPFLGRVSTYENIINLSNKTTLPLTFKIMDVRTIEGEHAPEILEKYPVKVWHKQYNAEEKSIEEIEAKRKIEYRPLLEIQEKSGDLTFWNAGNSSMIKTLPSDGYLFDIEVSNSGGRRYARNFLLAPRKERDYEPSQYDDILGIAKDSYLRPTRQSYLYGEKTGRPVSDVRVYIFENKEIKTPGSTFSVSVLDSLGNIIDIDKFKNTDFAHLVHGFNPRKSNGKITYDVAYPMPLVAFPSRYTNETGSRVKIPLRYNRMGRGGKIIEAELAFEFAIYREGHWEVQFRFNGESPNFENEQ